MHKDIRNGRLYVGDNVEILRTIPDGVIDLTVTSPPYDNLRDYDGYSFDFESLASELCRVTKDGGVVVWNVGDATVKGSETRRMTDENRRIPQPNRPMGNLARG